MNGLQARASKSMVERAILFLRIEKKFLDILNLLDDYLLSFKLDANLQELMKIKRYLPD
jgi:hypothetical protein